MITTNTLALAAIFTPHLYPMAVTLAILLTAAIFYPSKQLRNMVASPQAFRMLMFDKSEITQNYY